MYNQNVQTRNDWILLFYIHTHILTISAWQIFIYMQHFAIWDAIRSCLNSTRHIGFSLRSEDNVGLLQAQGKTLEICNCLLLFRTNEVWRLKYFWNILAKNWYIWNIFRKIYRYRRCLFMIFIGFFVIFSKKSVEKNSACFDLKLILSHSNGLKRSENHL